MLLKSADDKSKRLCVLEELQQSPLLDAAPRDWLQKELDRLRKGIQGEKAAAHYLNNYLASSKNSVLMHDLRFEVGGEVAQIDHLLLTRGAAQRPEWQQPGPHKLDRAVPRHGRGVRWTVGAGDVPGIVGPEPVGTGARGLLWGRDTQGLGRVVTGGLRSGYVTGSCPLDGSKGTLDPRVLGPTDRRRRAGRRDSVARASRGSGITAQPG
jgi:hypothetical protein